MTEPDFDSAFLEKLQTLFTWRRDVRLFRTEALPTGALERLLAIADQAPSVGLSQPWRFVIVECKEKRTRIRQNFNASNQEALKGYDGEKAALYASLKLQGLDQAPFQIAVYCDESPNQGAGLGRNTMPETLAYSVISAIQTLWLAARAEGIGMGWLSILDPASVTQTLEVPEDWRFIAYLCIGYPQHESDVPELEKAGWESRSDISSRILRR